MRCASHRGKSQEVFGVPERALTMGSFEHRHMEEAVLLGRVVWLLEVETES